MNITEIEGPFGAFGVNIVKGAYANSSDPACCLTIGLMIVSGSHVEINLDIDYDLHPEERGTLGVSIENTMEVGKPWTEKIYLMRRLAV